MTSSTSKGRQGRHRKKFASLKDELADVLERHYTIWRDAWVPHEERTSGGYHVQFWCHEEGERMIQAMLKIIERERENAVEEACTRWQNFDSSNLFTPEYPGVDYENLLDKAKWITILNEMFPAKD